MTDVSARNFGYLIAFLVPGFIAVAALRDLLPQLASWPAGPPTGAAAEASVGGFLHLTLVSVTAGVVVSTLRWLVIDSLHHATGIVRPRWNDAQLQGNLAAFEALVEAHYRFYQHYANGLVAFLLLLADRVASTCPRFDVGQGLLALLIVLYWFASRDCLRRYYRRTESVLGSGAACPTQESRHDQRTQARQGHARQARAGRSAARRGRRSAPRRGRSAERR